MTITNSTRTNPPNGWEETIPRSQPTDEDDGEISNMIKKS